MTQSYLLTCGESVIFLVSQCKLKSMRRDEGQLQLPSEALDLFKEVLLDIPNGPLPHTPINPGQVFIFFHVEHSHQALARVSLFYQSTSSVMCFVCSSTQPGRDIRIISSAGSYLAAVVG